MNTAQTPPPTGMPAPAPQAQPYYQQGQMAQPVGRPAPAPQAPQYYQQGQMAQPTGMPAPAPQPSMQSGYDPNGFQSIPDGLDNELPFN